MTEPTNDTFAEWVILELMGHRRLAGYLQEQEIGGKGFLRLDVYPREGDTPKVTQFYSPSSVYCITPTTEWIARDLGENLEPAPVSRFDISAPPERQIPHDDDVLTG